MFGLRVRGGYDLPRKCAHSVTRGIGKFLFTECFCVDVSRSGESVGVVLAFKRDKEINDNFSTSKRKQNEKENKTNHETGGKCSINETVCS